MMLYLLSPVPCWNLLPYLRIPSFYHSIHTSLLPFTQPLLIAINIAYDHKFRCIWVFRNIDS